MLRPPRRSIQRSPLERGDERLIGCPALVSRGQVEIPLKQADSTRPCFLTRSSHIPPPASTRSCASRRRPIRRA